MAAASDFRFALRILPGFASVLGRLTQGPLIVSVPTRSKLSDRFFFGARFN
jgi:hypothetical protein